MTGFKTAMGNDMKQEVFLADGYTPAEDEPFMNDRQVEYFRRKLLNWKAELLAEAGTRSRACKTGHATSPM